MDVVISFAHVASASSEGYVRPKLHEKGLSRLLPRLLSKGETTLMCNVGTGDIVVKAARHPCLEVQDDILFMPNDHEMKKGEPQAPAPLHPHMLSS